MSKKTTVTLTDKQKIAELETQLEEYSQRWKRALADYQNLEKRVVSEKREFSKFIINNLITRFLGVIDDLEKAQAHLNDQGLALVLKKVFEIFKQEGVEKFTVVGKDFDIHSMEAIAVVEGSDDNKVVEEGRAGYTINGSILRAAQVKVSKKKI